MIKEPFSLTSWRVSLILVCVMLGVVLLDNLHVNGFYLHWIPEMLALYWLGIWVSQIKILNVWDFSTVYVCYSFAYGSMWLNQWFPATVLAFFLGFPLLIGYGIATITEGWK